MRWRDFPDPKTFRVVSEVSQFPAVELDGLDYRLTPGRSFSNRSRLGCSPWCR